jgi:hypothetical protein
MAPNDPGDDGETPEGATAEEELAAFIAAVRRDPADVQAAEDLRQLLRRLARWQDLADHLEVMMQHTMLRAEQAALHDELADVLATRLESPLEAVNLRKRAEWWRDGAAVAAYYWQNLSVSPDDSHAWDEAEEFFRVNEMWDELAQLLQKRIRMFAEPLRQPLYDEIVDAYKQMLPPRWDELRRFIEAEIAAAELPGTRQHLQALLPRVQHEHVVASATARAAEERAARAQEDAETPMALKVAAVVLTLLILVIAVLLVVTKLM